MRKKNYTYTIPFSLVGNWLTTANETYMAANKTNDTYEEIALTARYMAILELVNELCANAQITTAKTKQPSTTADKCAKAIFWLVVGHVLTICGVLLIK